MTDTTTHQLPTTRPQLAAFLPVEPDDTTVSRARAGIRRLDELIKTTAADLDDHDRQRRAAAVALADAAMNDDALDADLPHAVGERHVLVERTDLLRAARTIVSRRQQSATTNDPTFVAWVAACRQVTSEWEQAMSAGSDDERFTNLVAFVEQHPR